MCKWLKSIFFGKKCHCESGCYGEKKAETNTPPTEVKTEAATEAPKEEIKA